MEKLYSHDECAALADVLLKEAGVEGVSLRFGEDGVHIQNSCRVRDKRLRLEVCRLLELTESFAQSAECMSAEWFGHNAFYRLTRHPGAESCDLEFTGDKRRLVRLAAKVMAKTGLR